MGGARTKFEQCKSNRGGVRARPHNTSSLTASRRSRSRRLAAPSGEVQRLQRGLERPRRRKRGGRGGGGGGGGGRRAEGLVERAAEGIARPAELRGVAAAAEAAQQVLCACVGAKAKSRPLSAAPARRGASPRSWAPRRAPRGARRSGRRSTSSRVSTGTWRGAGRGSGCAVSGDGGATARPSGPGPRCVSPWLR